MFDKKIYILVSRKRVKIIPKVPRRFTKEKYTAKDITKMFGININEYYRWKRNKIIPMRKEARSEGGIVFTITKDELKEFINKHIFQAQLKLIIKGKDEQAEEKR